MNLQPEHVLTFWRDAGPARWFKKDPEFDAEIVAKFQDLYNRAILGGLDHWAERPHGAIALIIVLDQFSRNMFRDDSRAFAQDEKCLSVVKQAMEIGLDRQVPADLNTFFYMPLMHSESLDDQKLCLTEMRRLGHEPSVRSSIVHLEIIEKFGRFPHRNKVLGRAMTKPEQDFLDNGGFSF